MLGLLGWIAAASLQACANPVQAPQLPVTSPAPVLVSTATPSPLIPTSPPTATPTSPPTATVTPSPTATVTPSPTAVWTATPTWTPFPTSLEAYGMNYDPQATPRIPPTGSVSMMIWGEAIPATPVAATPQFVLHPPPYLSENDPNLLAQAGCEISPHTLDATCAPDSPLNQYGCFFLTYPEWIHFKKPAPEVSLVATCYQYIEDPEDAPQGAIHIVGCAFKKIPQYIFQVQGEYVSVDTIQELQELYLPLESAAQALSYAQLRTGLHAYFDLSYDPTLLYLQDTIESTQVTEIAAGYRMNLYHKTGCSCEPWITSQVILEVGQNGEVAWKEAKPVYMTTGFGCAD